MFSLFPHLLLCYSFVRMAGCSGSTSAGTMVHFERLRSVSVLKSRYEAMRAISATNMMRSVVFDVPSVPVHQLLFGSESVSACRR
jgi:hypothetical protein